MAVQALVLFGQMLLQDDCCCCADLVCDCHNQATVSQAWGLGQGLGCI